MLTVTCVEGHSAAWPPFPAPTVLGRPRQQSQEQTQGGVHLSWAFSVIKTFWSVLFNGKILARREPGQQHKSSPQPDLDLPPPFHHLHTHTLAGRLMPKPTGKGQTTGQHKPQTTTDKRRAVPSKPTVRSMGPAGSAAPHRTCTLSVQAGDSSAPRTPGHQKQRTCFRQP